MESTNTNNYPFSKLTLTKPMLDNLSKLGFEMMTPIQSEALPHILKNLDVIAQAKTGSGKTAAFVWPMLVHCMAQSELKSGDGPIALICAPTRELCQQINAEVKRFGKCYNLQVRTLSFD